MTRVSYEQLKSLVASHCHGVPLQSLQHRVQQIAERHLPSHNDLLPLRAIHDCDQPDQLLNLLEKWALLSPTNDFIMTPSIEVALQYRLFSAMPLCTPPEN
ncbi:hypothetical protein FHG87_010473 [Trinorchestia longiramus]|nr:hypothetical protein FHG87_010473 [Trinorchestia longiramus]